MKLKELTCKEVARKTGIPVQKIRLYVSLFLPKYGITQGQTRFLTQYEQMAIVCLIVLNTELGLNRKTMHGFADVLFNDKYRLRFNNVHISAAYREIDFVLVGLLMTKGMSLLHQADGPLETYFKQFDKP